MILGNKNTFLFPRLGTEEHSLLALLENNFKLKTDLQKTAYQNDLEISSLDFFPHLYKTANHLSEVGPIIIAKEKPKYDKSSGGNSLS